MATAQFNNQEVEDPNKPKKAPATLFKNPYGTYDEATGKTTPTTSYTARTNPYDSMVNPYGADYQKAIKEGGDASIQDQLTSPEAVEQARLERSNLAGLGILGGSAYDVNRGRAVENTIRQGKLQTAQQLADAKLKGSEYDANTAFQKALFGSEEQGRANDFNTNLFLKAAEYQNQLPTMQQTYETGEAGKNEKATQMQTATGLGYKNDYEMSLAPKEQVAERLKAYQGGAGTIINTDALGMDTVGSPQDIGKTIVINGKTYKRYNQNNNQLVQV